MRIFENKRRIIRKIIYGRFVTALIALYVRSVSFQIFNHLKEMDEKNNYYEAVTLIPN